MSRPDPPPTRLRAWGSRIVATLITALFATPIAGCVGGTMLWLAVRLEQPEASAFLFFTFTFYGALIGGMIAAPVTLLVLPIVTLLLHARECASRWLLPLLGLSAGFLRFTQSIAATPESGLAPDLRDADPTLLLSGAIAGFLAGQLFAWLPRALSPRAFSPDSNGNTACATSP